MKKELKSNTKKKVKILTDRQLSLNSFLRKCNFKQVVYLRIWYRIREPNKFNQGIKYDFVSQEE